MFKKSFILIVGIALVLGLLFGRKLVPYAATAFQRVQQTVNDQVPISFQIDAARDQLQRVEKDVRNMVHQIAKEEVAVKHLEQQLASQQSDLQTQFANIQMLRDHLDSGQSQFVVHNRTYSNERVLEDLSNRFEIYKATEGSVEKVERILDIRRERLTSAKGKLDETIAQRRELEIQIENLEARKEMLDVAKTASKLNIDDSRLSQTRKMIDEIKTRLDVEEEMLNIAPKYIGQIPLDSEEVSVENRDILGEIDAYFGKKDDDSVAHNN